MRDITDERKTPNKPLPKPRRSMDMEFHDLNLDDLGDSDHSEPTSRRQSLERNENIGDRRVDVGSSDDDSFGEASDDCEPDQQYLAELLDNEYHPERLNLLQNYIPSQKKIVTGKDSPKRNGAVRPKYDFSDSNSESYRVIDTTDNEESDWRPGSPSSHHTDTSSSQQQQYKIDLSDHSNHENDNETDNNRWIAGDTADSDTELETVAHVIGEQHYQSDNNPWIAGDAADSATELKKVPKGEGEQDVSVASPRRMPDPGRPSLKKQLECMGKSTKKSFRTVGNKSFFAQPFKGLTRSLSGSKQRKNKSLSLEQQEVA
jgi:hypothetical protein